MVAFLAYGLISALAGIGIETLWNELKSADLAWITAALLLAPLSQIPEAFPRWGRRSADLLFAPVLILAVRGPVHPARRAELRRAGRARVRFFQRQGSRRAGLSIGLIDSVSGFVIQSC